MPFQAATSSMPGGIAAVSAAEEEILGGPLAKKIVLAGMARFAQTPNDRDASEAVSRSIS